MLIQGLQKLTLLDYPGETACTVFLAGCNLRCPFCHNASLVRPGAREGGVEEDAFFAFLEKRRGLLDGVCVTGGEPLLQPALPRLLRRIKALGYAVKLDTNGCFPAQLEALVAAGLVDFVAMDVKNSPARYAQTVGVPDFDLRPVQRSVAFLLSGAVDYEFRTTVVRELHTAGDLAALGRWIAGARRYFLQAFVDSGDLLRPGLTGLSGEEMAALLAAVRPFVPAAALRGVGD